MMRNIRDNGLALLSKSLTQQVRLEFGYKYKMVFQSTVSYLSYCEKAYTSELGYYSNSRCKLLYHGALSKRSHKTEF